MKHINILLTVLCCVLSLSCGPSKQELQARASQLQSEISNLDYQIAQLEQQQAAAVINTFASAGRAGSNYYDGNYGRGIEHTARAANSGEHADRLNKIRADLSMQRMTKQRELDGIIRKLR